MANDNILVDTLMNHNTTLSRHTDYINNHNDHIKYIEKQILQMQKDIWDVKVCLYESVKTLKLLAGEINESRKLR